MAALKPTANGTLSATPMASLLVYALDKHMNGTMVFESSAGGRSAVHFVDGAPAKAKTHDPVIHLGRLLLERGAIDDETYNRTLKRCATERVLHGRILLDEQAIEPGVLEDALREQTMRRVLWLFTLPQQSVYGFYDKANLLERFGAPESIPVEPLALVWRGIRGQDDVTRMEQTIARVSRSELRLHPQAQLSRFCFSSREWAVLDLLRARPQPLDALLRAGVEDALTIKRLVYALALTRSLDLGGRTLPVGTSAEAREGSRRKTVSRLDRVPTPPTSRRIDAPTADARPNPLPPLPSEDASSVRPQQDSSPPSAASQSRTLPSAVQPTPRQRPLPPVQVKLASSPGASPEPIPQPASPPAPPAAISDTPAPAASGNRPSLPVADAAAFDEIRQRSEQAAKQNYYEILGVERDAPAAQISAAFFQLAKRWHPDKLGPEFAPVRAQVLSMFSRMNEAHQVLSDETSRAEYEQVLESGGGSAQEQEAVHRVVNAINEFQKAEVLYKKRKLDAAELCARRAMEDDPEQADYVAMYTMIAAERRADGKMDDLLGLLDRAIAREPQNERARFTRAQIYKRLNRMDVAVRDFRWVAEQNPKNLDAVREVRLYNMRRGGSASSPDSRPPHSTDKPVEKSAGLFGKLFKR